METTKRLEIKTDKWQKYQEFISEDYLNWLESLFTYDIEKSRRLIATIDETFEVDFHNLQVLFGILKDFENWIGFENVSRTNKKVKKEIRTYPISDENYKGITAIEEKVVSEQDEKTTYKLETSTLSSSLIYRQIYVEDLKEFVKRELERKDTMALLEITTAIEKLNQEQIPLDNIIDALQVSNTRLINARIADKYTHHLNR